jgi:hypothetical protein
MTCARDPAKFEIRFLGIAASNKTGIQDIFIWLLR